MEAGDTGITDELSGSTGNEYGGGIELSPLGFLVLGLPTFWIYTVWKYHELLCRHVGERLDYFRERLDPATLPAESRRLHEALVAKGFRCHTAPRNVSLALYAASLGLILSELVCEVLVLRGQIGIVAFERYVYLAVGAAAPLFCAASLHFMSWVARSTRDHEYHELLLARFVQDPAGFKMVQPSRKFTTRWRRNQSRIALFLVLAVPMTISPVLAVRQIQLAGQTGACFESTLIAWVAALFLFAGIFHLAGTRLLLEMHNGHLRVEALNRELLARTSPWLPEATQSVLDEARLDTQAAGPGELLPQRVLAAIMITDMVGYSREMQHSEERTLQKLMRHNALVRASLARHGGREIKTMGDAFLVSFEDARAAVQAALEIQRDLSAYNAGRLGDERILIRIGIHTGEILKLDGDVLGNGVNIAARIEPLAEPGGICISSDTYERVKLEIDIQVVSLGRKELKNIANAPEIFRILREANGGARATA